MRNVFPVEAQFFPLSHTPIPTRFPRYERDTNQRDGSQQTKGTVLLVCLLACADQNLLCLLWKCGLGVEMALSVDARRGSTPCRRAFPGVLFIIKKCWNEILVILKKNNMNHQNHSNNAKKQKNFQMTKHLHRDLSTTNQKNRPFGLTGLFC